MRLPSLDQRLYYYRTMLRFCGLARRVGKQ